MMKIKDVLDSKNNFKITGMLRIESENERFFGPGRLQLLENIEKTGSISKAAKEMGMSYKKAWEMIHSMNSQTLKPLVETHTGGEKGGGTIVTDEGKLLMAAFKKLYSDFQKSFDEKLNTFLEIEN